MTLRRQLQSQQTLDLARTAYRAGQFDTALEQVRATLRADPAQSEAWVLEARIHIERNDPTEALRSLDRHDLNAPEQREAPDVTVLRAQALLRSEQDDAAGRLLQGLAEQFPDDVRAYEMLAGMALRSGKAKDAVAPLRELLRLRPHSRRDRVALARLLELDEPHAAIEILEATPPDQVDDALRLWLADLYHLAGRYRAAEDAYREVLALPHNTEDAQAWHRAGVLADDMGAYDLAARRLGHAIAICPARSEASLRALALVHLHAGEFGHAARCFRRLTRLCRADAANWAGLLVCALGANRFRLAARAQEGLMARAGGGERRDLLASFWVHAASGQQIARATAPESAMEVPPASATVAEENGPAFSPLQEILLRATRALQDQSARTPGRADAWFHLAQCHLARGQVVEARIAIDGALAVNPHYNAAAALRARMRRGRKRAA